MVSPQILYIGAWGARRHPVFCYQKLAAATTVIAVARKTGQENNQKQPVTAGTIGESVASAIVASTSAVAKAA